MHESTYRKLAQHLDRLPGGFAPSETDADIRLLQRLFRESEAALATHLTLDGEPAEAIAQRAGLPALEARQTLAEMVHKGLIFAARSEDGSMRYQAAPFVVGIYEFQINRLDKGSLRMCRRIGARAYRDQRPKASPRCALYPLGRASPQAQRLCPMSRWASSSQPRTVLPWRHASADVRPRCQETAATHRRKAASYLVNSPITMSVEARHARSIAQRSRKSSSERTRRIWCCSRPTHRMCQLSAVVVDAAAASLGASSATPSPPNLSPARSSPS